MHWHGRLSSASGLLDTPWNQTRSNRLKIHWKHHGRSPGSGKSPSPAIRFRIGGSEKRVRNVAIIWYRPQTQNHQCRSRPPSTSINNVFSAHPDTNDSPKPHGNGIMPLATGNSTVRSLFQGANVTSFRFPPSKTASGTGIHKDCCHEKKTNRGNSDWHTVHSTTELYFFVLGIEISHTSSEKYTLHFRNLIE